MQNVFNNELCANLIKMGILPTHRILLAISGGLDSVVLAHLLKQNNYQFALAHCNFQLRGKESEEDSTFVESLAKNWEVPFFVKNFDTDTLAKLLKISIQEAARQLRYEWFEEIRTTNKFDFIATAHHHNDNIETILFHLLRGTGLNGLTGIPEKSGHIIRPLLFASREQITRYAQQNKLPFREDSSNYSDKYTRNKIRHHLIPLMLEINPGFEENMRTNIVNFIATEKLYQSHIQIFINTHLQQKNNQIFIDFEALKNSESAATLLFEIIQKYGFNRDQAKRIIENPKVHSGNIFESKDYQLLIDRQFLMIVHKPNDNEIEHLVPNFPFEKKLDNHHFTIKIAEKNNSPSSANNIIFVNSSNLTLPLKLRHWEEGDRFQPLGMGGKSQKIKDFFINRKLNRFEKSATWLLCNNNGEIIWVVGLRQDERYKADSNKGDLIKITFD